MNKYTWILVVLVIVLVGWKIIDSKSGPNSDQPIKIGAVLSLSGIAAGHGEYIQKGMELAVEEINADGGIDGRQVELVIEDDHTAPKDATTAFTKLVEVDKVDGLIGGAWDFVAQPMIPLALSSKTAFISPSNFRIEGSFDLNEQSFVMLSDLETVIKALDPVIKRPEVKKIAVIRFQSAFGEEIATTIKEMGAASGKEVLDETYTAIGTNDFRTTILKLKQAGVDTVFLDTLDIDALSFLKRSRELGFKPTVISHTLIIDALAKTDIDKTLLENVIVLNWDLATSDFVELFEAKYNQKPIKSANQGYDSIYVLAKAVAESDSREEVSDYIAKHNFKTINGNISFTDTHVVKDVMVEVQQIKNGALVPLAN